jgi:hypothetical protein
MADSAPFFGRELNLCDDWSIALVRVGRSTSIDVFPTCLIFRHDLHLFSDPAAPLLSRNRHQHPGGHVEVADPFVTHTPSEAILLFLFHDHLR